MGDKIIEILPSCYSDNLRTRLEAYSTLTHKLTNQPSTELWGENVTPEIAKKIIHFLKSDLFNEAGDASYEAIGFLGYYIDNNRLMDLLTVEEEQEVLDTLIRLIDTVEEKRTLARALWSLAQSKFECVIYRKNLNRILDVTTSFLVPEEPVITKNEALQVIKSLMECIVEEMKENVSTWFAPVFVNLFHDVAKIRTVSYSCLNIYMVLNPSANDLPKLNKLLAPFIPQVNSHYCKIMHKLIKEECTFILRIWRLLVLMLDKSLHPGTALINGLLGVVEIAFKSPKPAIRVDAFKCWQALISNFATDVTVLNHPKRLKLLVAPFNTNNAKTEDTAVAKFHAWWFLITTLGVKAQENFESIIVPLLKFSFNLSGARKGTNEVTLKHGALSPGRKFASLRLKSIETLARLLIYNQTHLKDMYSFSVANLHAPVISSSVFGKYHQLIYRCVANSLATLDAKIHKQHQLAILLEKSILSHILSYIKSSSHKNEFVDLIRDYFTIIVEELECLSIPGRSISLFLFEIFELQTTEAFSFPSSVIDKRLFYIHTSGKSLDIMNGTLNDYFIHNLCTPSLLHHASNDDTKDRFLKLWTFIIEKCNPSTAKLFFFQIVIVELSDACQARAGKPDTIISLWTATAKILVTFVKENHNIDQGNGGENDWSCMYKTLLFAVTHARDLLEDIAQGTYQEMITVWQNLWIKFRTFTPLSFVYEPGCECEHVAKTLITVLKENITPCDAIPMCLTLMADMLFCMIDKFKFSELGKKIPKSMQSPGKIRKKEHPLCNLGSSTELLAMLMMKALKMVSIKRNQIMGKLCLSAKRILENVTQQKMIWPLVFVLLEAIQSSIQVNPSAKFNADVERKICGMWRAFCNTMECHVSKQITSDQMSRVTPLFITAFQSSHSGLKKQMEVLWLSKFANLDIKHSDALLAVLKEANLPPASISDIPSGSPRILYLQSPKGKSPISFMSKDSKNSSPLSTSPFPSPLQKTPTQGFKNLSKTQRLEDMKEAVFIKVNTTPKAKRVLTPHQREKMKKRAEDIPALYNDLSQSLSQLPSQFHFDDSAMPPFSDNSGTNEHSEDHLNFKGKIDDKMNKIKVSGQSTSSPLKISPAKIIDSKSDAKNVSLNSSYSDIEMERELREASDEMERSIPGSIITLQEEELEGVIHTSNDGKENRKIDRKRKATTPSKRSLDDIRKSLKGTKTESNKEKMNVKGVHKKGWSSTGDITSPMTSRNIKSKSRQSSERNILSPLKSPIKSSPSPAKYVAECVSSSCKTQTPQLEDTDSENELPNTQPNNVCMSPNILCLAKGSPNVEKKTELSTSRPSRNKRKTILEDESVYITPTKRPRLSSTNNSRSVADGKMIDCIVLDSDEENAAGSSDVHESRIMTRFAEHNNEMDNKESSAPSKRKSSTSKCGAPTLYVTPSKVTRSGRRIVAPSKDMPEPLALQTKKSVVSDDASNLLLHRQTTPSPTKGKSPSPSKKRPDSNLASSNIEKVTKQLIDNELDEKCLKESNLVDAEKRVAEVATASATSPASLALKIGDKGQIEITPKKNEKEEISVDKNSENDIEKASSITKDGPPLLKEFKLTVERKYKLNTISKDSSQQLLTKIQQNLDKETGDFVPEGKKESDPSKEDASKSTTAKGVETSISNNRKSKLRTTRNKELENANILRFTRKNSSRILKQKELPNKKVTKAIKNCKIALRKQKKAVQNEKPAPISNPEAKSLEEKDTPNPVTEDQQIDSENAVNTEKTELMVKKIEEKIGSPIELLKSPNRQITYFKIKFPSTKLDLQSTKEPNSQLKLLSLGCSPPKTKPACSPVKDANVSEHIEGQTTTSPQPINKLVTSPLLQEQKLTQSPIKRFLLIKPGTLKDNDADTNPRSTNIPDKSPERDAHPGNVIIVKKSSSLLSCLQSANLPKLNKLNSLPVIEGASLNMISSPCASSKFSTEALSVLADSPGKNKCFIANDLEEKTVEDNISKPMSPSVLSFSLIKEKIRMSPSNPQIITRKSGCKIISSPSSNKIVSKISSLNNKENNSTQELKSANSDMQVKDAQPTVETPNKIQSTSVLSKKAEAPTSVQGVTTETSNSEMKADDILKPASNEVVLIDAASNDDINSPEKSKKLSSTLGTPERNKLNLMKSQVLGSRAALMLACAKKTMKTRSESPRQVGNQVASSPGGNNLDSLTTESPSWKKNRLDLVAECRPWAKHKPSPDASPASSILKKRQADDDLMAALEEMSESGESPSTPISKNRRVSFADPPVSESVEIPRSKRALMGIRAQKRLDMTHASEESPIREAAPLTTHLLNKGETVVLLDRLNCFAPFYEPLLQCKDSIDAIAPNLTSASLVEGLIQVFKERGCHTVGNLCAMSEAELVTYPLRSPKISRTRSLLSKYYATKEKGKLQSSGKSRSPSKKRKGCDGGTESFGLDFGFGFSSDISDPEVINAEDNQSDAANNNSLINNDAMIGIENIPLKLIDSPLKVRTSKRKSSDRRAKSMSSQDIPTKQEKPNKQNQKLNEKNIPTKDQTVALAIQKGSPTRGRDNRIKQESPTKEKDNHSNQLDTPTIQNNQQPIYDTPTKRCRTSKRKCSPSKEKGILTKQLDSPTIQNIPQSIEKNTPTKEKTTSKQKSSPTKEKGNLTKQMDSPTKVKGNLTKQMDSPTKEKGNLAKQMDSPTKEKSNLTQQMDSPTKEKGNLTKQIDSPTKEKVNLTKQIESPTKEKGNLTKQMDSPTKEKVNLTKQMESPTKEKGNLTKQMDCHTIMNKRQPIEKISPTIPQNNSDSEFSGVDHTTVASLNTNLENLNDVVGLLDPKLKSNLFKTLLNDISYDKVIDIFYDYLKNRHKS